MPPTADNVGSVASSSKRPVPDADGPAVAASSRAATPPPPSERLHARQHNADSAGSAHPYSRPSGRTSDIGRSGVDADALRRELHRHQRAGTPGASPPPEAPKD